MESDIKQACDVMRKGGVILYPTDTIWGLGCDATRTDAIRRIYDIKKRADSKALITLVSDIAMLERYVDHIPEPAYQIIELAIKPVTIVYDHPVGLPEILLAADGSAAIRVTGESFSRRLCRAMRRPIISTSANISGNSAPATFREISPEIIESVDYVVSYRRDDNSAATPSSVIKLSDSGIVNIIRP